jgi:hypothetical protein
MRERETIDAKQAPLIMISYAEANWRFVEWIGRSSSLPPLALSECFFQIRDQLRIDVERPNAIGGDINPLA